MEKMKVIIKRPDEKVGHVANISNTLENLQKIVGGHIEVHTLTSNGCVMICNEYDKIAGLEPNFRLGYFFYDVVHGTVIICGTNVDEFDDVPIDMDIWKTLLGAWGNAV